MGRIRPRVQGSYVKFLLRYGPPWRIMSYLIRRRFSMNTIIVMSTWPKGFRSWTIEGEGLTPAKALRSVWRMNADAGEHMPEVEESRWMASLGEFFVLKAK